MQRLPALLLVGVLAEVTLGCVTTTTRIETTHVEQLERTPVGPPKGSGTVRVLAWQEDSAAVVRVQVVRHCPAAQELRVSRDEISKSRISGVAIAAGAVLGGLGTAELLLSNSSSQSGDTPGLLLLGASAAVFATALALTGEERKPLTPERLYQAEKPIPCSVEAWQGATVTLGAGPDPKEGTTGPKGELRFEVYTLPTRFVVSVNGLQVRDVGVLKNRQAAARLSPGAHGPQTPTGIRRPAAETPKAEPPRVELSVSEQRRQTPSAPVPDSALPPPPARPAGAPILPTGSLQDLPPPPPPPPPK